ncbi:MAG: isoprenylcysteine carboxylmethyltransferase family protein [Deltaproteobacteria bacterium]|nr:isoprenylcysteine carboxylmethyltransferase family protein [Deltaproteobacteria bacterium]
MASSPSSETTAPAPPSGLDGLIIAIGNFAFGYRDYIAPVSIALVALFTMPRPFLGNRALDPWWDAAGILVSLTGQALRVLVIGLAYIQRGGKNKQIAADKLVVEGIFAHARHPLYVGNFLLLVGLMMIWNSPWGYLLAATLGFGLFCMARAEEAFLARKFGPAFDDYCARVPRFIPNLRGIRTTLAGFSFDWKRVVRKEYGTTFSWTTTAVLLLVLERVDWDGVQGAAPAAARLLVVWLLLAAAWGTARWMKKTRRLVSPD